MKITDLYKKGPFPWITLAVVLCCILVTGIVIILPEAHKSLAWSNEPRYLWQYVSGVFLHGRGDSAMIAVLHLMANILMFVPYAVIIEKLLGHRKFGIVFLCSWLGISAFFQGYVWLFVPAGKVADGNGLSGSSYAVIVMGVYLLYRLFLLDRRGFFRQPLSYLFLGGLLGELFVLAPQITGVGPMFIHLAGILIGVMMTLVFRSALCLDRP